MSCLTHVFHLSWYSLVVLRRYLNICGLNATLQQAFDMVRGLCKLRHRNVRRLAGSASCQAGSDSYHKGDRLSVQLRLLLQLETRP